MGPKVKSVAIGIFLFVSFACRADISYAACSWDQFSNIDFSMPPFDNQSSDGFRSEDGQSGELEIFTRNNSIVALQTKYLTDESGLTVRFIAVNTSGVMAVAMVPEEPETSFKFAVCADGKIIPGSSPTTLFTDEDFRAMAESVTKDFMTNPDIAPYRLQLFK